MWHANLAENFNVSIPYMQIKAIKVRDSKFGHALVVETTARSGGYILGFRIDPYEKLGEVFKVRQRRRGTTTHAVCELGALRGGLVPSLVRSCVCLCCVEQEIKTLHEVYGSTPIFGIKYSVEDKPAELAERKVERKMDDVEIVEDEHFDALASYYGTAHTRTLMMLPCTGGDGVTRD